MGSGARPVFKALRPLMAGVGLLLQACATGHYSHIAESEADRREAEAERENILASAQVSPDVVMVAGNALLPGGLGSAGTELALPPVTRGTPVLTAPTMASGGVPLVTLSATRGGPLAALGAGATSTGVVAPFAVGAAPATVASAALLVNLSSVVAKGAAGLIGPSPSPTTTPTKLTAPVPTSPSAFPLTGLVKTVLAVPTGPLGH